MLSTGKPTDTTVTTEAPLRSEWLVGRDRFGGRFVCGGLFQERLKRRIGRITWSHAADEKNLSKQDLSGSQRPLLT